MFANDPGRRLRTLPVRRGAGRRLEGGARAAGQGDRGAGRREALAAEASLSGKSKCTIDPDKKLTITNEWVVQGTDRPKWTTEFTGDDGRTNNPTLGMGGGKVWVTGGGNEDKASTNCRRTPDAVRPDVRRMRLVEIRCCCARRA